MQSHSFAQTSRSVFPKLIEHTRQLPAKSNVWVFIMAGQSNMAGRAIVAPEDTMSNERILTINAMGELILAKEPLHFYEPGMAGLDCGLSFATYLQQYIPDSITLLLIPAAVGGSSITQWLGDSLHRNVQLLSNLKSKIDIAKKSGVLKAILWHQGESDAKEEKVIGYKKKLSSLHRLFRAYAKDKSLPVITGGIGLFSSDTTYQHLLNKAIYSTAKSNKNTSVIKTDDFKHKGDSLHFDSASQRLMGQRMAQQFIDILMAKR